MTNKEFAVLSWALLEAKVRYDQCADPSIGLSMTDAEYDANSIKYLEACRKLGKPNTIVHKCFQGFDDIDLAPIGIDVNRPSVMLILDKIYGRKG